MIYNTRNDREDITKDKEPWKQRPCMNPSHNFPMHLYIPPGSSHTHVCPGCGEKTTVTSPKMYLSS